MFLFFASAVCVFLCDLCMVCVSFFSFAINLFNDLAACCSTVVLCVVCVMRVWFAHHFYIFPMPFL